MHRHHKDDAGAALRTFWKPNGTVNVDRERQLRAHLPGLRSITLFLRAKTLASQRRRVAEALGAVPIGGRTHRHHKDDAGAQLRTFWKPNGTTVDPDRERQLRAQLPGVRSITIFLRSKSLASHRRKIAKALAAA